VSIFKIVILCDDLKPGLGNVVMAYLLSDAEERIKNDQLKVEKKSKEWKVEIGVFWVRRNGK
jgi:hypothetical protein